MNVSLLVLTQLDDSARNKLRNLPTHEAIIIWGGKGAGAFAELKAFWLESIEGTEQHHPRTLVAGGRNTDLSFVVDFVHTLVRDRHQDSFDLEVCNLDSKSAGLMRNFQMRKMQSCLEKLDCSNLSCRVFA